MKKLKLLLLTRFLAKSQGKAYNQAGDELLSALYLELGDELVDTEVTKEEDEEIE